MNLKTLVLMLFLGWNTPAESRTNQETEKPPIILELGEQRVLRTPGLLRYSISGNCIRYTRSAKNLLIKAIKPGSATAYLETQSDSRTESTEIIPIRVVKSSAQYPTALLEQLSGLSSLEVIRTGGQFVLRGTLDAQQEKEAKRLALIRERFPQTIIDEVEISESWKNSSQNTMAEIIEAYPEVQIRWIENQPWVTGSVSNAEIASSLSRRLKIIQPLVRTQIQSFSNKESTVYLRVYLLEVSKEQLGEWGVEWPARHGGQVSFFQSKAFLQTNKIDVALNALEKRKSLKILSSPELVVKTPGKAELFAGGEMPIRQRSRFNDNVTWKTVGLSLKIETLGIAGAQIRIAVETSLSHFNDTFSNDEIPGVQNNQMKTSVEAQFGKPILLSGLIQDQIQNSTKGLPLLQRIPILGSLFSSDSYLNNMSELVAVLVPFRAPPESPLVRVKSDLPRGFLPLPRGDFSQEEVREAMKSSQYPWNVL